MWDNKKYSVLFIVSVVVAAALFAGCQKRDPFQNISEGELEIFLQEKNDGLIFLTQELCGGCERVEENLKECIQKNNVKIYRFEIETQTAKELLYQYGLNQVPAIISISQNQVNVYKGALTEENIERVITTQTVEADRINSIKEINYEEFCQKLNKNCDFFVYFGKQECSDCIDFTEVLKSHMDANNDSGVYYLDLNKIKNDVSEEEYKKILDIYGIKWIPYVLHIKNGVMVAFYEYPKMEYRQNINNNKLDSEAAGDFLAWMDNELK